MTRIGPTEPGDAAFELHITANTAHLHLVRGFVHESAMCLGCPAPVAEDLIRAVDEACQNVIRYAYGGNCGRTITVTLGKRDNHVIACIIDTAPPIDPAALEPRPLDTMQPGGLGVHVIRACVDEVSLDRAEGGGNCLRLTKRIG
ncbi:serine/threonine-protein kinase RsbW/sigma-B regulation protein RsbU (phosphoserine phosphatase) [Limimonas halophila]|uniref:Serine/threonine-protein kinase RsbW/sigma-B regulation protein RsbU (Phosphoserine phosphatase) n=1 Tax=Limimonas halophila TaxID=1082479 RepID=A0A1G7MGV8_9PROT|nr:ATP-binding protein [Limimonas halophila]SDF60876.1 serine/threonine-protein kinase RsbW/sigma-B regulation protein RsbU (phosphoserine phosphatase) [Limimonas halophila]